MHRLLEYLMLSDLFMSFRPDVESRCMVVTFRKTNSKNKIICRSYRISGLEINLLNIDTVDVMLDFAYRFMDIFNEEEGE